jgi:integrase/recombinase XerD
MTKAYLEIGDVKRLEGTATCLRDRLLIRILFHLGCRVSEALALEVEDIDLEQGTVTIGWRLGYPSPDSEGLDH